MTEHDNDIDTPAPASDAKELTKAELQRQMEAARESISETMAEIKETVAHQYDEVKDKFETVKESVEEVLDWREKFKDNPIAWGAGAISVGILIGIGLSRTVEGASSSRRRGKSEAHPIADLLLEKLSGLGDAVLPTISGSLKEMFGIDLADYLNQPPPPKKRAAPRKRATKKLAARSRAKKSAAKKSAAEQPDIEQPAIEQPDAEQQPDES